MRAFFTTLLLSVLFSALAQSQIITVDPGGEQTIYRQAGNYSEEHDIVTIAVLRGTAYRAEYDDYLKILIGKLDSMNVPHKIFQEFDSLPGTSFHYFIENDPKGPLRADELIALLPHMRRSYMKFYGKSD